MIAEGLIKLPEDLYNELKQFTLKWYFAHVYASIERRFRFDENAYDTAHRLVDAACKLHGVHSTVADAKIAREKFNFTKAFTLDENVYGEEIRMRVTLKLVLERKNTKDLGTYNDQTGFIILSAYNLHMTGASLSTISSLRYSLGKVELLLSHLRHELTHLVQFRALAGKHAEQVVGNYSAKGAFDDAYALSTLEFDPLIKSAQGVLSKLEAKYKFTPGYNKRMLTDAFICVIEAPPWMLPDDQSSFFEALKRRAPTKWRKAIKLFMAGHKY